MAIRLHLDVIYLTEGVEAVVALGDKEGVQDLNAIRTRLLMSSTCALDMMIAGGCDEGGCDNSG